ncbi:hypothetical protein ACFFSY_29565 [Paenibacillus aurantiacus]|uniref:Uncharacterized protein n=1 Tax=Paenibacillus aurantiacus TaxID=1936118 RepID=A0ABV5L1C4_9BACL
MNFLRGLFFAILLLGPSMYFGYKSQPAEMGIAVAAGALVIFFLNLDKFQSFKAAGVEAQLKEVQKVVNEAHATLQNLKEITNPLSLTVLSSVTHEGRWGGMGFQQKIDLVQELDKAMVALNFTSKEFEQAKRDFYRMHIWDMFDRIVSDASNIFGVESGSYKQLRDMYKRQSFDYPTEQQIRDELKLEAKHNHDLDTRIVDYLYFIENKTLRNPIRENEE